MIVVFIRFAFKPTASPGEREAALAAISRTAAVPSVSFSTVGRDLGDPAEGFTHAYCVGVADIDKIGDYVADPTMRTGDFLLFPLLERFARASVTDDPDPEIGSRIQAIFARQMASDPEWAALLVPLVEAAR